MAANTTAPAAGHSGANSADDSEVVSAQRPPSMRLTTKIQVSGARFILRRLEHAIVRHNTAMFDDPMRFYSRASTAGLIATVIIAGVCLLMAFLKPQGAAGEAQLLADTTSGQLFVLDKDTLRPVYNLTSARLIIGQDHSPRRVKSSELSSYPRGQTAGIPGAPYDTPTNAADGSYWSICDTVSHPANTHPTIDVAVLADQAAYGPDTASVLAEGQTAIARFRDQIFLVDSAGRHSIDLANAAVTAAINLPPDVSPTPVSEAMYNALAAADPIAVPAITGAGEPNPLGLDPAITIGTVITNSTNPEARQQYVVLADGVAPINDATAAALRNTDTYGHLSPPVVAADTIAEVPLRSYRSPLHPVTVIDRAAAPVLCWSWSKTGADSTAPDVSIAAGKQIPLPAEKRAPKVNQITTDVTVYQTGGGDDGTEPTGRYVRVINPTGNPENRFYIDPGGVRYGLPNPDDTHHLGLTNPELAPWPAIRLLAAGPDLTQDNALLEHDTLPADPSPRAIPDR